MGIPLYVRRLVHGGQRGGRDATRALRSERFPGTPLQTRSLDVLRQVVGCGSIRVISHHRDIIIYNTVLSSLVSLLLNAYKPCRASPRRKGDGHQFVCTIVS